MRIIQIIGHSGSGKTTFILSLIRELKSIGTVAVIKHLGHHLFRLDEGKDTTRMYEAGADLVAGIDAEKTVLTIHEDRILPIISFLSDSTIDYLIIEGFKSHNFPSIVFGDLKSEFCVLREPTTELVINKIEKFFYYETLTTLIKKVSTENNPDIKGVIAVCKVLVLEPGPEIGEHFSGETPSPQLMEIESRINNFKADNGIEKIVYEFQEDILTKKSSFFFGCRVNNYESGKKAIETFRKIIGSFYSIIEVEERLLSD